MSAHPALVRLAWRARSWLRLGSCVTDVYRHDLAVVPSLPPPPSLDLAWLDPADVPSLAQIGPALLADAERRLRRGDRCLVGRLSGRPVHYGWVQTTGTHVLQDAGRRRDIAAGHCWIYDCYTSRRARGLGIYPFALCHLLRDQAGRGRSCAWIYTLRTNAASASGIRRAGFRLAESLPALAIGPWGIPLPPRR